MNEIIQSSKIIDVVDMILTNKDTISITLEYGFLKIHKELFNSGFIFRLQDKLYLIGQDVIYIYRWS